MELRAWPGLFRLAEAPLFAMPRHVDGSPQSAGWSKHVIKKFHWLLHFARMPCKNTRTFRLVSSWKGSMVQESVAHGLVVLREPNGMTV